MASAYQDEQSEAEAQTSVNGGDSEEKASAASAKYCERERQACKRCVSGATLLGGRAPRGREAHQHRGRVQWRRGLVMSDKPSRA